MTGRMNHSGRFKRHKTRHRGITYRLLVDGSRRYSVTFEGRYLTVDGDEREAVAVQAQLRAQHPRGLRVHPAEVTFEDAAKEWLKVKEKRLRPYTLYNYQDPLKRILLPRFGSERVGAIMADDIAALIRDLEEQGLATKTIQNYLLPLGSIMALAVRRGWIATNPYKLLTSDERPKRSEQREKHRWSEQDVESLILAAKTLAARPRSRTDWSSLLTAAVSTGLRLGELLGLQWGDIDLARRELRVRRQWTRMNCYGPTKTEAGKRRLPLSDDLVDLFSELRHSARHSDDEDPVFATRNGTPHGHRNVTRRAFEPAAALAGLNGVTFHDLRHAFASRMIAGGLGPVTLASLMGHEDIRETLNTYSHVWDEQRTDEVVRNAMSRSSEAEAP
jgi:integrase